MMLEPEDFHLHLIITLDPCTQTQQSKSYAKWQSHLAG
jgi:hypothetical protein